MCCNSVECWSFSSKGLATVGQDEVFLCLDCHSLIKAVSNDESNQSNSNNTDELLEFPRDIFRLFTSVYDSATKGIRMTEFQLYKYISFYH